MSADRPQIATFALRRLRARIDADQQPESRGPARAQIVLLAALGGVVLAVALAAFLVFGSQTGTASVAAQHFCDAIVAQDYATAYADLSQTLQQEGTEAQFAASQQDLDRMRGRATACTFTNAHIATATASFTLLVTRSGTGRAGGTAHLVFERGMWKVADYDSNVI
jgi:hypothetical protein